MQGRTALWALALIVLAGAAVWPLERIGLGGLAGVVAIGALLLGVVGSCVAFARWLWD